MKTKVGVIERFNGTLKSTLKKMINIDKNSLDEKVWKDLLSEELYQYNSENTQRTVGKTPAEVTDRDEELFASHKYAQMVNTQHWWDAKVNGPMMRIKKTISKKKCMRRFQR